MSTCLYPNKLYIITFVYRSVYKEKLAKYVEDPAYKQLVGWKSIPEMVNGRLSMLGMASEIFVPTS